MTVEFELVSVRFQNVRGFYDATLPLDNKKTLIVGRNHAGKTSAFLLLSWLFNDADPGRLIQQRRLNKNERELILPARTARHRARRITLNVRTTERQVARRYKADKNLITLRIGFRITGGVRAFIQLGEATKSSGHESDGRAAILLTEIQDTYSAVHIPAARDATSQQFHSRFRTLFENKLAERALHPRTQSGATTEYRQVSRTIESPMEMTEDLLRPLLDDLAQSLPAGLMRTSKLDINSSAAKKSLVSWIVDQIALKLITGDHDDIGVRPANVGAGLQSVLDMAAASVILKDSEKKYVVAVEEPESFLHPSMQRLIARMVLSSDYGDRTLVSTHSPILVEEARYENLLLAVDRKFIRPREGNARRLDINTALLASRGAEMVFATSVLLVEGPGDRAFFEGLRRRLAKFDESGRVDDLFVIEVGGKTSFAQWIKLVRGLNGHGRSQPISFLVVPDGDAIPEVQRAFRDSRVRMPSEARHVLMESHREYSQRNFGEWRSKLNEVNSMFVEASPPVPLCFLEGDLEFTMFSCKSREECTEWAEFWGFEFIDRDGFIKKMGSKAIDGSGGTEFKAPYMRKQFAGKVSFSTLSENVKFILRRWLIGGGIAPDIADRLLSTE